VNSDAPVQSRRVLLLGAAIVLKIEFTPDQQAEIVRLYTRTLTPVRDIAALMQVSRGTIEKRIRLWALPKRKVTSRPIELMHAIRGAVMAEASAGAIRATPIGADALAAQRAAVAVRILEAVEIELDAVQRVLEVLDPGDKDEAERTARTLASLARTLREAAALNQPEEAASHDDPDDDPVPGDIDEFRRELARRLQGLVDLERARESEGARGDQREMD
jgi:hypothetical protein